LPTILTHALIPLVASAAFRRRNFSLPLTVAAMAAAVIPDADVAGFALGIDYAHALGHRGASHSIAFALLVGVAGALLAPVLKVRRAIAFGALTLSTLSHPLADMLTNGGLGVALFWPASEARIFFPWRPILVSPIGLQSFFAARACPCWRPRPSGCCCRLLLSCFWSAAFEPFTAALGRPLPPSIDSRRLRP
jgi:inner membrane protein